MPEGPQVHLVGLQQQELFGGKYLTLESPDGRSSETLDFFNGKKLRRIDVIGKHLLYIFGRDEMLHIHLGRFGKFRSGAMPASDDAPNLRFRMASTEQWAELRGAAAIERYDEAHRRLLEARIGPDPLNGDDPAPAFAVIRTRRAPIGSLLMDQSIIAGVGNIYRAEMLFRAKVTPFRAGNACDDAVLHAMWDDVRGLMHYSLQNEGRIVTTHPHDRLHPKKKTVARGEAFYVYHRAGRPCRLCGTTIESREMASRTVFYCPQCQT